MGSARNDARKLRTCSPGNPPVAPVLCAELRESYVCEQCGHRLTNQRYKRFRCPSCGATNSLSLLSCGSMVISSTPPESGEEVTAVSSG